MENHCVVDFAHRLFAGKTVTSSETEKFKQGNIPRARESSRERDEQHFSGWIQLFRMKVNDIIKRSKSNMHTQRVDTFTQGH